MMSDAKPIAVIGAGLADRKPKATGSAVVSTLFLAGSAWNTPPSPSWMESAVDTYTDPLALMKPLAPMTSF